MVASVSPSWIVTSCVGRVPSADTVIGLRLLAIDPPRATGWARDASLVVAFVAATVGASVFARDAAVAAKGSDRTSTATEVLSASRRPRTPTMLARRSEERRVGKEGRDQGRREH